MRLRIILEQIKNENSDKFGLPVLKIWSWLKTRHMKEKIQMEGTMGY